MFGIMDVCKCRPVSLLGCRKKRSQGWGRGTNMDPTTHWRSHQWVRTWQKTKGWRYSWKV